MKTRYCSLMCARHHRWASVADRFWSFVDCSSPDGCWPWIGKTTSREGYGRFSLRAGVRMSSGKMTYLITNGKFPEGKPFACHTCDNPPCCRPDHIFAGDTLDNAVDSKTKGRRATGSRNGHHTKPEATLRGEQLGQSKLTDAKVRWALQELALGSTQRAVAKHLQVSYTTINWIAKGKTWTHIERIAIPHPN